MKYRCTHEATYKEAGIDYEQNQIIEIQQEQIYSLKDANEVLRFQWADAQYSNAQLRAQVNCLRDALTGLTFAYSDAEYNAAFLVLSSTPEQCLAEVKAKAVEDMLTEFNKDYFLGTSLNTKIAKYIKQLRGQVYADRLRGQVK